MSKRFKRAIGALLAMVMAAMLLPMAALAAPTQPANPDDGPGSITVFPLDAPDKSVIADHDGTEIAAGSLPSSLVPLTEGSVTVTKVVPSDATQGSKDPDDYITDTSAAAHTETISLTGAPVRFANLVLGYYKIEDSDGRFKDILVRIPMEDPATGATGWMWDVFLYPKAQLLDIDKDQLAAAPAADTPGTPTNQTTPPAEPTRVWWEVKVEVPDDVEDSTKYIVTDTLDAALRLDTTSPIRVFARNKDNGTVALTPIDHYTNESTAGEVKITFTEDGRKQLALALAGTQNGDPTLYIQFATYITVDENGFGLKNNTAEVDYVNKDGVDKSNKTNPDDDTPGTGGKLRVFNIEITKLGPPDISMDGTVFQIYADNAGVMGSAINGPGNETSPWQATVTGGKANFNGLNAGTYWLYEVSVPAGIATPHEAVQVVLSATGPTDTAYKYETTIQNFKKPDIPQTGGRTALILTVAGLLLIGGGFTTTMVLRKRRGRQ